MTKFASLLGRKPALGVAAGTPAASPAAPEKNVLELDQELFFPLASQLGGDNEVVRNLLIDAEHKITELGNIRSSLGRLVDPVSKTLRAFEEAKSEKLSLQSVLNNTRIAYSKLREDLTAAEKKATTLDTECLRLRELLTVAQQSVTALEATRTEQSAELSTRRAHIIELQRLVQQQSADLQATRDESQYNVERAAAADRRMTQLEAEAIAAVQKSQITEQERNTLQILLEKALADCAVTSRRLLETETSLQATQSKLKKAEAALAEALSDRTRLTAALDEANETLRRETVAQNARFEALQARATLSEKLLEESRQALAARADEISAFDRRLAETTMSRGAIETKFGHIETALTERDVRIQELEEKTAGLAERNSDLLRSVGTRENAYNRAQERIQAQDELIQMLETQIKATRETYDLQTEDLRAQLQREQLDRSMAEGALEAGRKDVARLLRELATLQHRPGTALEETLSPAATIRVQNAA